MDMDIIEEIFDRAAFEALKSGERRMLVVAGEGSLDILSLLVNRYAKLREGKTQLLYSNTSVGGELLGLDIVLSNLGKKIEPTILDFDDSEEAMGETWDVLLADFSVQMRANDIGRLVETIRGGGLVLFAIPSLKVWLNTLTLFQRKLVSPPFSERDVKQAFKRRFISKLRGRPGVWFVDIDSGDIEGIPRNLAPRPMPKPNGKGPVKSLALTEEQLRVIDGIADLAEARGKSAMVIIADRGRGKSAALGLGLSQLVAQGIWRRIVVTAPTLRGAKTLFHFLKLGLKAQGLKFRESVRDDVTTRISSGRCSVVYMSPVRAAEVKSRVKVVDEAASIPTYILFSILRSSKLAIFSTTVHGYEGAGRSFSLRFLERLRKMRGLDLMEIRMKTPIRYPEGDPVEKWLYEFLLLDAEPADIEREEFEPKELEFSKLDVENASEEVLKQFYGIYVLAHYRNRPNDLALLLDAPHHTAWALTQDNKVLVSVQLAEEGKLLPEMAEEMLKGWEPPGHMIPNRMVLHYGFKDFARLWGWRIVRIATHPSLQGKGLGSLVLKELEQKATDRGMDWIGAGFGASPRLLNFWLKNGFIPVHISPSRNPTSGEFSVFVLKPLNKRTRKMIDAMSYEFKSRLLGSLHDVYFTLSPSVARLLLTSGSFKVKLKLSMSQRRRLKGYLLGTHTYEMTADAIKAIVQHYFIKGCDIRPLKPWEEDLVVAKTLQGRGWDLIKRIFKMDKPLDAYREIIGRLVRHYVQKEGLTL